MKKILAFDLARDEGLTLIEIMIVVAILGLLAALIGVSVMEAYATAQVGAARAQISEIQSAIELHTRNCNHPPTTAEGLAALVTKPANCPAWKPSLKHRAPPDPWGNAYDYASPGTHGDDAEIRSRGPDGVPDTADDLVSWDTPPASR